MPNRIKRRLLIPLAIALLVLLGTTIFGFYQHDQHFLDQEINAQITRAEELFQTELEEDAELMEALITFLKRDPCLQQHFIAADRDGLLRCAKPLFEHIRREHRITHFYFHSADQVNFLRIHNPPRFGDHIGRFTMKEAVSEGENASGIELGPFGTFTLRTVSPWYIDGKIVGYIELGEEIEHITPEIKEIVGVELILLIDKQYLNQKGWEEGLQMMGREGDWNQISDLVIIDRTLDLWTPELEAFTHQSHRHITNDIIELENDGQQYVALGTRLTDAGNRHVGHFLILKQTTGLAAAQWALLAPTAITALAIVSLLFIFSSIYLGRIQQMLIQTHTQLQTKLKEHKEAELLLLENEQKLSTEIAQRKNTALEEKALGDILSLSLQPLTMQKYLQETLTILINALPQSESPPPMGAIFLTQQEGRGNILNLVAAHNLHPSQEKRCAQIPFGVCICGQAAATGKSLTRSSTDKQHSIRIEGMAPHSQIATPITHGATALGVINLYLPPNPEHAGKAAYFLKRVANALSMGVLRRYTDSNLKIAIEQAKAASKAKSDFLATMSHEVRTPMNGVLGVAELLQDTELDQEQREFVGIINQSGQDLMVIINDILDFSKAEAGHLELEPIPFDLESSAYKITQLLSTQAEEKGLELILHYSYDCPRHLMADAGRIRQILVNLVTNAIKFTEKGHILIEISCLEQTQGEANIQVSVQDTGIGIPPEVQDELFKPFTQADSSTTREYGGTGLGLAICKQIIELMGGNIGVKSTVGEGATFWFNMTLPMEEAPSPLAQAELQGVRILAVDDNSINLQMLHEQLSNIGMRVTTTADPHQAIDMLRTAVEAGDPYSLALLDYLMPNMNGEQLGRAILADETLSSVPLILFTSSAQRGDGKHFKEIGFSGYLSKPILQDTLHQTLASVLAAKEKENEKAPFITRYQASEALVSQNNALQQLNGRILLVEDNIVNQKVALSMLRKLGLYIETADDGKEAVEYWSQSKYDLILMDCQMPKLDGYAATKLIREQEQEEHIPIIALTANAMDGAEEKCLTAGMNDYIAKPFKQADLASILHKWLT